jgi:hypothetical protein
MARCPAHEDRTPSLSVTVGDRGSVLLHCFAGCPVDRVLAAMGLTMRDLHPAKARAARHDMRRGGRRGASQPQTDSNIRRLPGLTVAQYAEAKRLDPEFLHGLGLMDIFLNGTPAVRIPYFDTDGRTIAATRFRLALTGDRFQWKKGSKQTLYGLNRLEDARTAGFIVLVEGESDVQTLWSHGIPALGLPGASSWREEWAVYFDGIEAVYIVIEADQGGESVRKWLAKSAIRDRVRLVTLDGVKDPSELHLTDPAGFKTRWEQARDLAVKWIDESAAQQQREAKAAFAMARPLLDDPAILDRVGEAMRSQGYAGDLTPPLLAYLAMTSRLLERPINLVFVAPSAAGKNRTIDAAAALIPAEAVYVEKAGSARALIYNDEDFQHRVVVVNEADSIPEDGSAASAIRSLAADNVMTYDVVERNERTGHHHTRRIEKPGPTGLITTSTKSLRTQLGTRHLEVTLPDDPGQVRTVMLAHARSVAGTQRRVVVDSAPLLAVQRWLALAGERRVDVPFAEVLANLMPATPLRMNRDFLQLLTAVQAVALLRQCQRETVDGIVIATLDDYAEARKLLASVFDTIAAEGVTKAVRQTVEAVQEDEEVTQRELATRLQLATSTVSWRVRKACKGGWLVKDPATGRIRRGAPLPDEVSALPTPEAVRAAFESSNGSGGDEPPPSPSPNPHRGNGGIPEDAPAAFPGASIAPSEGWPPPGAVPARSLAGRPNGGLPQSDLCRACGQRAWWQQPSGDWVCGVCHPDPRTMSRP